MRLIRSRMQKFRAWISTHYHNLIQIRDTPHAIAGGLAIGTGLGFTPLLGFKTILAVLVAWLFRCSKLSAAVGVTLHDVLFPVWPVILRWQYLIGFWLINHHLPPKIGMRHLHIEDLMHWKALRLLWPIFLGSLVMAIPLALVIYWISLGVVQRYQDARSSTAIPD